MTTSALRVRWLGRVAYEDGLALQRALFASSENYLLLLEHEPVYTLGVRGRPEHLLVRWRATARNRRSSNSRGVPTCRSASVR